MNDAVSQTVNENDSQLWLEVATVVIGQINVDMSIRTAKSYLHLYQEKWLKKHDRKSKRLHFLWQKSSSSIRVCGCQGGCVFFDKNVENTNFFESNGQPHVDIDSIENNDKVELESSDSQKQEPSQVGDSLVKTETESNDITLRSSKKTMKEYPSTPRASSKYSNIDLSTSCERRKTQGRSSQGSMYYPLNSQTSFNSDKGDLFSNRRSIIADYNESFSSRFDIRNRGDSFTSCNSTVESISLPSATDSIDTVRPVRSISAATVDTFRTAPSSFSSLQSISQVDDDEDIIDVTVTHEKVKAEIIHEESIDDDNEDNDETFVNVINSVRRDNTVVSRRRSKSFSKQCDDRTANSFSTVYTYYVVSCDHDGALADVTDGEEMQNFVSSETYAFKSVGDRVANIPLLFHRESKVGSS